MRVSVQKHVQNQVFLAVLTVSIAESRRPSPIWSPFRLGHQALSLTAEHLEDLGKRVDAGGKKAALAREFGISRETLYQYLHA